MTATISPGPPIAAFVGFGGVHAEESASRVRSALHSCGFAAPRASVVIQASPSTAPTRGPQLDLAVAAAILVASKQIPKMPEDVLLLGELALDGSVLPARGFACYGEWCDSHGMRLASAPADHTAIVPLATLGDLRSPDWAPCTCKRLEPAPVDLEGPTDTLSIFNAYQAGDEAAESAIKKMSDCLGYAMAQISTIVDPQVYLIGGGVGGGFTTHSEDLRIAFRSYCLAPCAATRVLPASLGNDAAMYGCAY